MGFRSLTRSNSRNVTRSLDSSGEVWEVQVKINGARGAQRKLWIRGEQLLTVREIKRNVKNKGNKNITAPPNIRTKEKKG